MRAMKRCVASVLIIFSVQQYVGGFFKAHFPPTDEKMYPRLLIRSLPALDEFTVCTWVRLFNLTGTVPHILSYATVRTDDEIALFLHTVDDVVFNALQVVNQYVSFRCRFVDWKQISWHHVCASWRSVDGNTSFFADGKRCSPHGRSYGPISVGISVQGGGLAILGQEQGDLGFKFDVHEAWSGDLSGFNMWGEILDENRIQKASKCDEKTKGGTVISWSKTPMAAYDGVVIRKEEICEG